MKAGQMSYVIKHESKGYLLGPERMLGFSWKKYAWTALYSTEKEAERYLEQMDKEYKGVLYREKCKIIPVIVNEMFVEV